MWGGSLVERKWRKNPKISIFKPAYALPRPCPRHQVVGQVARVPCLSSRNLRGLGRDPRPRTKSRDSKPCVFSRFLHPVCFSLILSWLKHKTILTFHLNGRTTTIKLTKVSKTTGVTILPTLKWISSSKSSTTQNLYMPLLTGFLGSPYIGFSQINQTSTREFSQHRHHTISFYTKHSNQKSRHIDQ